jgi:hypothetical protein
MATEFLSRLRAATQYALRLTIPPPYPLPNPPPQVGEGRVGEAGEGREGADDSNSGPDMRALFSRLASPSSELVGANASWQPKPPLIRIEIMASGPFGSLRGIRTAVNRLQHNLVTATRNGTLELRLTEIQPRCRHSTAWSREALDPGAATTEWQCFVEAFASESERSRTLFASAFRESLRNQVNHVVVFGDRFDDGLLFLGSAIRAFRRQGVRVSTFYLGDDFNGRKIYHFLALSTGGVFMHLSEQKSFDTVLPVVAAFACGDRARLAALSPAAPEAKALIAQLQRR